METAPNRPGSMFAESNEVVSITKKPQKIDFFQVKELYSKQTLHGSVVTRKFHLELNMITSFFIYQMHKIRCISTEQIQLPREKAVRRNKFTFLGNKSFCLRVSSRKGTVPTCVYDSVAECHWGFFWGFFLNKINQKLTSKLHLSTSLKKCTRLQSKSTTRISKQA